MLNTKTVMTYALAMLFLAHPLHAVRTTNPSEQPEPAPSTAITETTESELPSESVPNESTPSESTTGTSESSGETNDDEFGDVEILNELVGDLQETPVQKKTVMNMSKKELNALSIKEKAKLVGISVKEYKMMTEVITHEAGTQMNDKILVAAVIWNRKHCKQFKNSIKGVINEPGQFYDLKKDRSGRANDKKAQLAILLAYKQIKQGKIPHNVLYFNSISYHTKNPNRYKKYKHYANYFIKDTYCKCKWCK